MKAVIDYVKSLLPTYGRRDILSVIEGVRTEHNETTAPIIGLARELLTGTTIKSDIYKNYEVALRKHVQSRQPSILLMLDSLERMTANFDFIEKEIRGAVGAELATDGITYEMSNLIHYVDAMSFYTRYARRFLLKIVTDLSVEMGGAKPYWVRSELEYLTHNMVNFAGLFNAMYTTESELKQKFRKVTNAIVEEETSEITVRSLGIRAIDPFETFSFTPQSNFILSFGKLIVEWQVARHQAAQADLQVLQVRLQELRELRDAGNASPRLQKVIQELESRLTKLNAKVTKFEEDSQVNKEF